MIVLKLIYWHFCWSIGPYLTTFMLKIWSNYIFFSFSCLLKTTVCRLSNVILKDHVFSSKQTSCKIVMMTWESGGNMVLLKMLHVDLEVAIVSQSPILKNVRFSVCQLGCQLQSGSLRSEREADNSSTLQARFWRKLGCRSLCGNPQEGAGADPTWPGAK